MSIAKITLIKAGLLLAVLALIDCIPHELAHAISTNSIAKQSSKPLVIPSFLLGVTNTQKRQPHPLRLPLLSFFFICLKIMSSF